VRPQHLAVPGDRAQLRLGPDDLVRPLQAVHDDDAVEQRVDRRLAA